jgi:hypothetical protein
MVMEATTYSEFTIPEKIILYAAKMIFCPIESLTKKCLDLISKIDEDCFV